MAESSARRYQVKVGAAGHKALPLARVSLMKGQNRIAATAGFTKYMPLM